MSYLLSTLLIVGVVHWLQTEQRKRPRLESADGSFELRHGWKYLCVAVVSSALAAGSMPVVALSGLVSGLADTIGIVAMFLVLTAVGVWMVADAVKTRVIVSAGGVTAVTPLGGTRFLKWTDIDAVSYNPWAGWLLLESPGRPSIRVGRHLRGTDALIQRLREQVGSDVFHGFAQFLHEEGGDAAHRLLRSVPNHNKPSMIK